MIDHLRANLLFDTYGKLLTDRQREIVSLYLEEDFSLAEIQEELSISRAAVQSTVKKALKQMEEYESVLHAASLQREVGQFLQNHPEFASSFPVYLQQEQEESSC